LFMKLFLYLVVLNSKINPYYVSLPHLWKEDYIPERNLTLNTVQNFILPWDKSASQECAELSWYATGIYLQAGCVPYTPPHNHLHPTVSAGNTTNGIHLNNPHILMPFIQSLGFLHFTVLRGNYDLRNGKVCWNFYAYWRNFTYLRCWHSPSSEIPVHVDDHVQQPVLHLSQTSAHYGICNIKKHWGLAWE
jgi:hypothetical protein